MFGVALLVINLAVAVLLCVEAVLGYAEQPALLDAMSEETTGDFS